MNHSKVPSNGTADEALGPRYTTAIVCVLGFRGGIGSAVVERLLQPKARWNDAAITRLLLVDYLPTLDLADAARRELLSKYKAPPDGLDVVHWDAAELASTAEMVARCCACAPRIDGLVVTTGLGFHGDLAKMDLGAHHKALDRLIKVNLVGPALAVAELCRLRMRPDSRRPTPSVVLMSSFSGLVGLPHRAAYCASKFGLNGFAEGLYADMPHLRVVLVCPTTVATGFRDAWKRQLGDVSTGVKDNVKADVSVEECVAAVCAGLDSAAGPGLDYVVLKGWKVRLAAVAVRTALLGHAVRLRVLRAANKL